jgi:hypothetical protein
VSCGSRGFFGRKICKCKNSSSSSLSLLLPRSAWLARISTQDSECKGKEGGWMVELGGGQQHISVVLDMLPCQRQQSLGKTELLLS